MADEIPETPQIEGQAKTETDGVVTPQPTAEVPISEQPGAEKETQITPVAPEKTFTEKEVKEREAAIASKLQAETAQYQRMMAQLAMQNQIAQAEQAVAVKDRQDVESGQITQQDADQRKILRQQSVVLQQHVREQAQQGEILGRVTMAYDLGVEYGINPEILVKDSNITTPMQMMRKAAELAVAARDRKIKSLTVNPESYDKGPGTGGQSAQSEEENLRQRYPTMFKK